MRKHFSRLAALGAFFVLALAVAACGSGVPGNSVASIDGNPITTQAFNHWLLVVAKSQAANSPGTPVIIPDAPNYTRCMAQLHTVSSLASDTDKQLKATCKEVFTSYAGQVMGFLIQGYWYQLEAARDHVSVSNSQVQKAFDKAKNARFPTAAEFDAFLSQSGETLQDVLFQFRVDQIAQKLLAKATAKVTPAAIAAYYNANKSKFGTPETRNVRLVLTKTLANANAAKAALASGQSWNKVAAKYSTDPTTKNSGGLVKDMTQGELDPAIDTAAFAAPLNQVLGPVKGQFGYYVYDVIGINPATQQSLAQATALIRSTLTNSDGTSAQSTLSKRLRAHWLSHTSCRAQYNTTVYCPGYKAPATSTTQGG